MKRPKSKIKWRPQPKVATTVSKWSGTFTVETWVSRCSKYHVTRESFEDNVPYCTVTAHVNGAIMRQGDRQTVRYFISVKQALFACCRKTKCILPHVPRAEHPVRMGHKGPLAKRGE